MDVILETIVTACDELDDIPLYEIIIESIRGQEDDTIYDAVLSWDNDLIDEIMPHVDPAPTPREFYEEAIILYFFKELEIYLGFNVDANIMTAKYFYYKFTNDTSEVAEVLDKTNMEISLATIRDGDLSIITDCYSNNPLYKSRFQKYVDTIKKYPKYRNNKRLFRMKVIATKGIFLDSWIIEYGVLKRDIIRKIVSAVNRHRLETKTG